MNTNSSPSQINSSNPSLSNFWIICATEFERELIRARTGEGRTRAKAAGVHMGRPSKLTPHQQREAIARRDAGEALTDIARTFGVSHTTIGRLTSAAAMG